MPNRQLIKKRVRELVSDLSPESTDSIEPTSRLLEDLSLDSVALLELAVTLEQEFDLPAMSPEHAGSIATVEQLENYIADRVAKVGR